MPPTTIMGINQLSPPEKREIYARLIPRALLDHFHLSPYLVDIEGNDLLELEAPSDSPSAEMSLYHRIGFPDPVLYGHMTDTVNGQIHVLLYILNDPNSPRFDVDRMPDGRATKFGTQLLLEGREPFVRIEQPLLSSEEFGPGLRILLHLARVSSGDR